MNTTKDFTSPYRFDCIDYYNTGEYSIGITQDGDYVQWDDYQDLLEQYLELKWMYEELNK